MEKIKQNVPLLVGLALPVIMIILVALSIYLPRFLSSAVPQYDFLYMANNNYSGCTTYSVQMGRLIKFENQNDNCKNWRAADGGIGLIGQDNPMMAKKVATVTPAKCLGGAPGTKCALETPKTDCLNGDMGTDCLTQPVLPEAPTVIQPIVPNKDISRFFLHNVTTNISKEITYEDALKLGLNSNAISADGYEVKQNYGNGGIFTDLFGGGYRNYEDRYLVGNGRGTKLQLFKNAEGQYYYSFQFLGWVVPQ